MELDAKNYEAELRSQFNCLIELTGNQWHETFMLQHYYHLYEDGEDAITAL